MFQLLGPTLKIEYVLLFGQQQHVRPMSRSNVAGYQPHTPLQRKIKRKHENFLLFIPSFGNVRNPEVTKNLNNADPINLTLLNDFELALLQYANFKKMIALINAWDEDSLIPKILIKAHPSEPISEWKRAVKGLKKTFIVGGGDISPWIIASSGVIHNGSTGAIEAYYAKKPGLIVKELTVPYLLPIASGISEYEIFAKTELNGFDFSKARNLDFNPSVLSEAVTNPAAGAVACIIDNFDELGARASKPHNRIELIFSQFTRRSFRRAAGLIRDEIYWKFGLTNINSQLNFVPGSLDGQKIKMVTSIDPNFAKVRYRRMTLNLWEFDV